ncbi:MAG TPA: diguanylate cyclase [Noviherbaspirillum sp.]|nr:diguanylate cyclase [Noviherbaspirillum sp.]
MNTVVRRLASKASGRFWRLPLAAQLALCLLAVLPAVWIAVMLQLYQLERLSESESRTELRNLAHAFADSVDAAIDTIDLSLGALRGHWGRDPDDISAAVGHLQARMHVSVGFDIGFVDTDGVLQFSTAGRAAQALDLSDRDYVQIPLRSRIDQLFIGTPVIDRLSDRWIIPFSRPVYAENGDLNGVIVLSAVPGYFSSFYSRIDLGERAAVTLVRSDGRILARSPDDEAALGRHLRGAALAAGGREGAGFYQAVSEVDGIERFHAWRALPESDLIVVVGKSMSDMHSRYAEQRAANITGGIVISLLLTWVAYILLAGGRNRARTNARLAESEARWAFALEGSEQGVWDWDIVRRRVQLSARSRELLGIDDDSVPGTPEALLRYVYPDDAETVQSGLEGQIKGESATFVAEHRVRRGDGVVRWILSRGMVAERDEDGRAVRMVGTFSDITDRKSKEAAVLHRAQHDSLTGLPNRATFLDRLEQALARARREGSELAVMFFDLDRFKPVNDTYGHHVGDLLLREVAERAASCLRRSDTVARLGGDEFTVLLPRIASEADALTVAEHIRAALAQPFRIGELELHVAASIGVASFPSDGDSVGSLTKAADEAMYVAKAAGRNTVRTVRPAPVSAAARAG